MNYTVINDILTISECKWRQFVSEHPKSCYFHSHNYYKSLMKSRGHEPLSVMVINNSNVIGLAIGEISNEVRWLPHITKRTILYAEPIYTNVEVLNLLLAEITKNTKGLFCQIRPFYNLTDDELKVYSKYGFIRKGHYNSFIPVRSPELLFKSFGKDKRKGVKKARNKYNLKIVEYNDKRKSVDLFYSMMAELYYKKRHAIKSKDYFMKLASESNGDVRIVCAVYDTLPIASQLYMISGNRLTAYYTATLPNHKDKHAGDLLIWYLLNVCYRRKIPTFDFGGGGAVGKQYQPRDYKKRFGTQFQDVGRFTYHKSILYTPLNYFYKKMLKN